MDNEVEDQILITTDDEGRMAKHFPHRLHGRLPNFFLKKACDELHETSHIKSKALRTLRDIIRAKDKSAICDTREDTLLLFLRARKFDVARTFELMKMFFHFKKTHFDKYPISQEVIEYAAQSKFVQFLPYRTAQGEVLSYTSTENFVPDKIPVEQAITLIARLFQVVTQEPASQISGIVFLNDCECLSWAIFKLFKMSLLSLIMEIFLNSFPLRVKGFHIINLNMFASILLKIIMPLLPRKISSRVHIHGKDRKSLYQHIPQSMLPRELGGTLDKPLIQISAKEIASMEFDVIQK